MSNVGRSDSTRRSHDDPAAVPGGIVRWEIDADRILTVWLDAPGKSITTLSAAAWDGLDAAVHEIEAVRPAGVVFASAKPRSFIAGADLFELQALTDAQLDEHLARGQRILDRIAALPIPTVAAINGDALGGGLELALACRCRVAADDPRMKLGLPETTLGLVPGWGGTSRLPRLVGLEPALSLMLSGRSIPPAEAKMLGLVDRVAPREQLLVAAKAAATEPPVVARRGSAMAEEDRAAVLARCRADVRRRSGDHLPAPLVLVDIVETGCGAGPEAAAAAERRGLISLRATPAARNLLRLFSLRTAARKAAAAEVGGGPRPLARGVVIGGGTMGAGIAAALAAAGVAVNVVEASEQAAAAAGARLAGLAGSSPVQGSVPVSADWGVIVDADIVIEAVVEEAAAKLDIFRRLDRTARPDAILASNTSSLSIAELAAAVREPSRVIGLHFFNPVAKMPLVEVVRPPAATADAVATGVAVATLLGKIPVICRDAPGFVVNRVLFPYLRAAVDLAAAGTDIQQMDAAVRSWGMPMGPCVLMDEIGLDVTLLIFRSLERSLGPRLAAPPLVETMVARGWLGRKARRGFYDHPPEGRPVPNPEWRAARGAVEKPVVVDEPLVERRLIGPMSDEARLLFDEHVVASADAVDLATVLGIGFPAFRGGLATYAATVR
jgi:3-hydroxyacyl-CoA dehydrogenase/enoyl-CoA hydratase/3-hydroxybutyryl-CoA epimerase